MSDSADSSLDINQAAELFAQVIDPTPPEEAVKAEAPAEEAPAVEDAADAATEAEPAAEPDDPTVTVKIDGKDVEVKLSELKQGYQRQSDYTRKTMAVSDAAKAAQAETQKAQQERQAYAANLQRIQLQVEMGLQEQQKIDWAELLERDPVEYLKQQHLANTRQAQRQQVAAELQKVAAIQEAENAKAYAGRIQAQTQELLGKLPEWADEAKAKAEKSAIRDYLLTQGYEAADTDNIADARAVVLARKAMLYDQMMSRAKAEAKRVSSLPPKVERPGVGDNPGIDRRSSAFQKLGKSGRVEDAAAVFASLLQ